MSSAESGTGLSTAVMRFWYRHTPQLFLSELLEKRWMEPVVAFILMCAVFIAAVLFIPGYASLAEQQVLMRNFADRGFLVIAVVVTLLSGGMGLSGGSVFFLPHWPAMPR